MGPTFFWGTQLASVKFEAYYWLTLDLDHTPVLRLDHLHQALMWTTFEMKQIWPVKNKCQNPLLITELFRNQLFDSGYLNDGQVKLRMGTKK